MSEEESVNEKASQMGWVPQDEWKGDPDRWRPADEFVQRGENIIPIIRDRMDKLEADLKIATKSNKQAVARAEKKASESAYKQATSEYEAKLAELDKKELEAFDEADSEKFQEVKKERLNLKEPEKPKEEPAGNPVFEEWAKKNTWYDDDSVLQRNADFIAEEIFSEDNKIEPEQLFNKVTERIKKEFPHKFKNAKREEAQSVDSGTGEPEGGKKMKFADLPKAAKDQFTRLEAKYKASGDKYTKEAFLEAYNE